MKHIELTLIIKNNRFEPYIYTCGCSNNEFNDKDNTDGFRSPQNEQILTKTALWNDARQIEAT